MLEKARKDKNKNNLRKEKNMRCNRGNYNFFPSYLLRSVEAPMLIKLRYTVYTEFSRVPILRLLGFFLQQEIFRTNP